MLATGGEFELPTELPLETRSYQLGDYTVLKVVFEAPSSRNVADQQDAPAIVGLSQVP